MTAQPPVSDDLDRLATVRKSIVRAIESAGRKTDVVRLVCVTKTIDKNRIQSILEAGHRHFGENRVQEAEAKWPELRKRFPDLRLSLIGPLQTNKVREAVELFDAIETVDRPKLAQALAKEIDRQNKAPELFVQVNIGEEPQKAGVAPGETDAFLRQCREAFGLRIAGLMCIPPLGEPPSPYFALLAKIAARNGLTRLSMGMSSDFERAIQLGATEVRVGSGIFGERS